MPADQYSSHCPACNTDNRDGAKRCGLCNRLLPGVAVSSQRVPRVPPPPVRLSPGPGPSPSAPAAAAPAPADPE